MFRFGANFLRALESFGFEFQNYTMNYSLVGIHLKEELRYQQPNENENE